jgi:hypothetical protein
MNYIGQYNSISSWEKKDKEDIENMSLAKKARYYQSLIKDRRLEKIIDSVNSEVLKVSTTYKNLNSISFFLKYNELDLIPNVVEYYKKEGFKVSHEKCLTEESFRIEW